MALLLQLRTRAKMSTFTNPSLFHFFSTSNSEDDEPESTATSNEDTASGNPNSPFSYFSDVKKVLKQGQSTSSLFTPRNPSNSSSTASDSAASTPPVGASFDEIRKKLSQFRRRYSDPDSTSPSSPSSNQISLQEIYRRNVVGKPSESTPNADLKPGKVGGRLSFDAIRESVRNIKQNVESSGSDRKDGQLSSLSAFAQSLRKEPSNSTGSWTSSTVIGGTGALPTSIFGKELREKERGERSDEMKMEFLKIYKHEELGEKLRKLRPQEKGRDWFSLRELNDRLVKLRDMEEKENAQSTNKVSLFPDLRNALMEVKVAENNERRSTLERLDILGGLGRTPSFILQPPKEHLVEKYFHPDNMSSEEKLKMELARIRDEFKMSESDCGSFRVQVAQLTTKIKHLSSVLHKKDKHSRKGLIAMVQKRKRLLKYLRRTDWESYCFVISKLGLRDNPDTKY